MLEGKAVIDETDMLETMQQDAVHLASKALDFFDVTQATEIARFIKMEFDRTYGGGWQCIVGTNFGSFVTHCSGSFIYFQVAIGRSFSFFNLMIKYTPAIARKTLRTLKVRTMMPWQ
ncbi:dynein light chain 1, cytoplasmic isoform X1 [Mercurialis annua]|uniref:dynein light chain 1, cytoplasmic isoform X1 n=1 Tax=Mercurialis annua TaxID=3986 RepID=UPI002160CABF|nr:dynein light chain 1, cytoplasmic isoform X1 [Mercurialis annua]